MARAGSVFCRSAGVSLVAGSLPDRLVSPPRVQWLTVRVWRACRAGPQFFGASVTEAVARGLEHCQHGRVPVGDAIDDHDYGGGCRRV